MSMKVDFYVSSLNNLTKNVIIVMQGFLFSFLNDVVIVITLKQNV